MFPSASTQLVVPAPTMALPSTTGTQLALPALTSQPSTEPVVVPVLKSADATKYLKALALINCFINLSFQIQTCLTQLYKQIKRTLLFLATINFNVD